MLYPAYGKAAGGVAPRGFVAIGFARYFAKWNWNGI